MSVVLETEPPIATYMFQSDVTGQLIEAAKMEESAHSYTRKNARRWNS